MLSRRQQVLNKQYSKQFVSPQLPLKFVVKPGIYNRMNLNSRWNSIDAFKPCILKLHIESKIFLRGTKQVISNGVADVVFVYQG